MRSTSRSNGVVPLWMWIGSCIVALLSIRIGIYIANRWSGDLALISGWLIGSTCFWVGVLLMALVTEAGRASDIKTICKVAALGWFILLFYVGFPGALIMFSYATWGVSGTFFAVLLYVLMALIISERLIRYLERNANLVNASTLKESLDE